jgi:hypothetical protein
VFAVDANQNVILAAYANSPTTALSADSTAVALVLLTDGIIPSTAITFSELVQDVQSAAGYDALVASITASLSAGTPPLQSSSVVQNVSTVVDQILKMVVDQNFSSATVGSNHSTIAAQQPLVQAFPGPPVQILGPTSSLPTFLSVYISASKSSGVSLINSMPFTWEATSTDQTGATLSAAETLDGTNPLVDLLNIPGLEPPPLSLIGNGKNFTVTVFQTQATAWDNARVIVSDVISLGLASITGIPGSGASQCSNDAALQMLTGLGDSFQSTLLNAPTGQQAAAILLAQISKTVMYQALRTALQCVSPKAVTSQAVASLFGWLVPELAVWKTVSSAFGAVPLATDLVFWAAYWNTSQPIEVCQSAGALVNCLVGTWTYSGTTTSGAATTTATTTWTFNSDGSDSYSATTDTTYSDGTPSGSTSCTFSGTYALSGVNVLTITTTSYSELCGTVLSPYVTDYTITPSPPPSVLTLPGFPGQNFIEQ